MYEKSIDPPLRKRRKAPKTKTGCQTCRERRIKCDEERPACRRCVASKRKCPGYEAAAIQTCSGHQKYLDAMLDPLFPLIPHPPSLPFPVNSAESNTFDYFRLYTDPTNLNGPSWLPSWAKPVLLIGQKVPAAFHAIISFSAFYQWSTDGYAFKSYHQRMVLSKSVRDAKLQFAIDQYCKSLKFMREYVQGISDRQYSDAEVEICLAVCLLFLSIEILRFGNNGDIHYNLAMKIIRERAAHRYKSGSKPKSANVIPNTTQKRQQMNLHTQYITPLDTLIQTFAKMDTDLCFRGQNEPQFVLHCCKIPTSFLSLEDAQVHLDVLANAVHRVRGRLLSIATDAAKLQFPNATANDLSCLAEATSRSMDLSEQAELVEEMEEVRRQVASYMSAFVAIPMEEPMEPQQTHLKMQMHFTSIWIIVSTWRDEDESSSDRFDVQFRHMISTATRYLQLNTIASPSDSPIPSTPSISSVKQVPFTLESNIALCLFLVSAKCRKSNLRKQAAKLLRRASLCGLFDSMLLAEYADRLVDLEEHRVRQLSGEDMGYDDFDYEDVPEAARIIDSVILVDKSAKSARLHFAVHAKWPESSELEVLDAEFNFDALRLA